MTYTNSVISGLVRDTEHTLVRFIQAILIATLLAACGGGAETETQPPAPIPIGSVGSGAPYLGNAPDDDDTQAFRVSLWEYIREDGSGPGGCGQCHSVTGGISPMFARSDDVNLAYDAIGPYIDRDTPQLSELVEKVSGGHNCWLGAGNETACADTLTRWIENWLGGGSSDGRQIILTPPNNIRAPGESKNFPGTSAGFSTLHELLVTNCSECHTSAADTPQAPYFAAASIDEAYEAAKTKINLDVPANSRLVVRLSPENHNCWFAIDPPDPADAGTCAGDASIMLKAITDYADGIVPDSVDPLLATSSALTLGEGIVASGGDRFEEYLIALWEFKQLPGTNVALDTSGVEPSIPLTLSGNADFINGWGIQLNGGRAQSDDAPKLYNEISDTGEYAVEVWAAPANVTQDEAFIVSYSGSNAERNFTLGQTLYNYDFFNRSEFTSLNGDPALSTPDADERLQATLQHVVINFDPVSGRSIFVNGMDTGVADASNPGGSIADWSNNFPLIFGNEASGMRPWQGTIRMVAIHNRKLTPAQIQQNFDVGVGQKFFMLFHLDEALTGVPESYLMFEVSQFDNYSYLFNQPRFISLDPDAATNPPGKVAIAGIQIGINGRIGEVGQAFQTIDTRPAEHVWNYTPDGHFLSTRGTIIAQEKGATEDEFFLCFEVLGTSPQRVCLDPVNYPAPATPPDTDPAPQDYGLRTFEEINATLSALTGVPTTLSTVQHDVRNTYLRVKQQLPTDENMGGFLAAHQMAVAQLAIEYCNALVDDMGDESTADYWPGFNFGADVATAFGPASSRNVASRDLVLDPLIDRITLPELSGTGLSSQPSITDMKGSLNTLIDELVNCRVYSDRNNPNAARNISYCTAYPNRTEIVVKAVCGAAIGNAAMLVQ